MNKLRFLVTVLILGMVLAACSNNEESEQEDTGNSETEQTEQTEETEQAGEEENTPEQETEEPATEAPVMENDEVVAVVNGEEILGEEFNLAYAQTEQVMQQYGQEGSSTEQLKEQTVQSLVDQVLLRQDAEEKGIEVEDAAVEENLEQVRNQFEDEEQYQSQLEALGISEEMLREQVAYSLTLNQYVENELEVPEVTDEEVEEYYAQVAEGVEDAPPLEEVEEEVRSQLAEQKEREEISARVDELREDSEIEIRV